MVQPQTRLKLAVEDLHLAAHFQPGEGWRLHVWARRQGETTGEAQTDVYSRLTTAELGDLVDVSVRALLGL